MNVIELRNELDKLISKGNGKQKVFYNDGASGLVEIIDVKENYNTWDDKHIQLM